MHGKLTSSEGATVVLFALLLGAGVLLGLLALVVDSGQGYQARRDAQDVADLASLSIAYQCVKNATSCTDSEKVLGFADEIATANASGKRIFSTVTQVCGRSGPCKTTTNRYECGTTSATKFIRVYTKARTTESADGVPYFFAPLAGGPTNGAFAACSQSRWGQVGRAPIQVPIMLSMCEFSLTSPRQSPEWKNGTQACSSDADFDGKTHPGSFRGFLPIKVSSFDASCSVPVWVSVGDIFKKQASDICKAVGSLENVLNSMLNQPKIVPIVGTQFSNSEGTVAAFAFYKLLGFTIDGKPHPKFSTIPWASPCIDPNDPYGDTAGLPGNSASGNKCIYGEFLTTVIPYQTINENAPNLGVNTIKPIP